MCFGVPVQVMYPVDQEMMENQSYAAVPMHKQPTA